MIAGKSVALLLIHDGRREAMDTCIASALQHLPRMDQVVWVDDSRRELGFSGAIQCGWEQVQTDYVFHLEQDFWFTEQIPLEWMVMLLRMKPYLTQVALKRQPVNSHEIAAGGIMEMHPGDYEEQHDYDLGMVWTEHRRHFTTNPCVYSAELCKRGWPQVEHSEGIFSIDLLRDPARKSAYWGAIDDPPMVQHIGHREGWGY